MGHSHSKANLPKTKYAPQQTINITHFSFIYQLGKGTFCKVIAAENNLTGEILALKYCFKEKLHEKKAINHIVQERNLLEDISHPFICNILYSFQDHAYVYMALELMTGGDLRDHVASPMPESGVRIIIAEIASALEYLHVRNIVHRDLKPDNILLDKEGHAYLTDFNVAVIFKAGTPLRSVAGTEPYMAPELFNASGIAYYTSVDWWSLGVVMFEMIYADRPFRGKQKKENIMKGEYKMPTSKFTHLSTPCKNFIKDLLQTNLTKRLGCGLEGMKKYKDHPFFKTAWIEKPPKNVIGAEPPDVAKKIKPINWRKLERKEIEPLFVPFAPRVILDVGKKKKIEKNTEEDKAKEAEKEADFIALENVQRKEFQDQQPAIEYPALKEKFLYYDYNYKTPREKIKSSKPSFVDLERVVKSSLSLLSGDNTSKIRSGVMSSESYSYGGKSATGAEEKSSNQGVPALEKNDKKKERAN